MYTYETKARLTYADTDKMGYCYYGNYPRYYEIGRTELMRSIGLPYRMLEDLGVMMPVISMNVQYIIPVFYDELFTIKTTITEMPSSRAKFEYEIYNEAGKLANKGDTVLVFINPENRRPCRAPQVLIDCLKQYFK